MTGLFWLFLILLQVAVAVVILYVFQRAFAGHVTHAAAGLKQVHQENLRKQETLNQRLAQTEQEYKEKVEAGQTQARMLRRAAEEDIEKVRQEVVARARQEAERIITEAKEHQEELRAQLMNEIEKTAMQYAYDAVRYVFSTKVETGVHRQLVDEVIEEIDKLDTSRVTFETSVAEISIRQELTPEQSRRLEQVLSHKLHRAVTLNATVDPTLVAGLVVKLDSLVIDGSLKERLKTAMGYVRKSRHTANAA